MTRTLNFARRLLPWSLALLLCLCSGEIVARLDDWTFDDVPFLANPDRERDLLYHDTDTLRGKPNGRFKKYHLNAFGFRGPEMTKVKPSGVKRILVLGAS